MKIDLSYNLNSNKILKKYVLEIYRKAIINGTLLVASYITIILILSTNSSSARNLNVLKFGVIFFIIFGLYFIFLFKLFWRFSIEETLEYFKNFDTVYFDINNEYLKFKCDVIEQKLYWSDIEKVKFSKDYILIKYKSEMIFISKGGNVEKIKEFENYVKEYYVANKP